MALIFLLVSSMDCFLLVVAAVGSMRVKSNLQKPLSALTGQVRATFLPEVMQLVLVSQESLCALEAF